MKPEEVMQPLLVSFALQALRDISSMVPEGMMFLGE